MSKPGNVMQAFCAPISDPDVLSNQYILNFYNVLRLQHVLHVQYGHNTLAKHPVVPTLPWFTTHLEILRQYPFNMSAGCIDYPTYKQHIQIAT
jgi:hypothetical protein